MNPMVVPLEAALDMRRYSASKSNVTMTAILARPGQVVAGPFVLPSISYDMVNCSFYSFLVFIITWTVGKSTKGMGQVG